MASSDFYLKVKGVEGEAKAKGHDKEIEISSWNWGVSNGSSSQIGSGAGRGRAVPQDLIVTANYGKQSANLAQRCAAGAHIEEVKLFARKAGGEQEDYMIITMGTVFISSVQFSGVQNGDVSESVSMAYKKIKFEYKEQDDKGKLNAGPEFSWDIEKNEAKN